MKTMTKQMTPDFSDVADLAPGIYPADRLNPPSGADCTHLLVREDGSLGWCYSSGEQSEDANGQVSTFTADDLLRED